MIEDHAKRRLDDGILPSCVGVLDVGNMDADTDSTDNLVSVLPVFLGIVCRILV